MWRCRRCFKLATGFAIPYGRCRLCDGELQMFTDGYAPDAARLWAVREAVQAELDAFLFYKLARRIGCVAISEHLQFAIA